jgi:hypothetical protein
MEELSVLDYLKAKLTPWRGPAPEIPPLEGEGDQAARSEATAQAETEIADRDSGASEVVGGELSEGLAVQEQAPNALHETLSPGVLWRLSVWLWWPRSPWNRAQAAPGRWGWHYMWRPRCSWFGPTGEPNGFCLPRRKPRGVGTP